MVRRRALAILIAASVLTAACSSGNPESGSDANDSAASSPAFDDGGRDADYLFDQELLHTFEFTVAEDDLAFLDRDPTAEEYVPATMTFEGQTIEIGLRYKGAVGAFVGCVDGPDPFTPTGQKICTKLSLKAKINWNSSDDEFFGVRKLQLHSMNNDPSQLRERIGYHVLREMGVAAPRSTHARVIINGEFVGLFALTENIDGRFTRANFDDGTGNLYKEAWPFQPDGSVTSEATFLESLRTNENDDDVNASLIQTFADELLEADDPADVVRRYMDVEALMNQLAVDRTIRHDDGPFHWYCDADRCNNHNFFFYENPTTGMITMIPWDLDNAFTNIVTDVNPVTPIGDGLGEITNDCDIFAYGTFGLSQRSASCDPLFAAWAMLDDEYQAAIDRLHAGPLSATELDPWIDAWVTQIQASTTEASSAHDDAVDPDEWTQAVAELRGALDNPIGG